MKVANISELGRATQGVKLIKIDEGDEIAAITRIDVQDEAEIIPEEVIADVITESDTTNSITDTTIPPEAASEEDSNA
jgi:DNA gyrase subunit A